MFKYFLTFEESQHQGYDELEVFDQESQLLTFLEGKDFHTFSVIYGKVVNLKPKTKVTSWEIDVE